MTLPVFDSLEQVPEPFRPFYREDGGKVVPDLVPGSEAATLRRHAADLLSEKKALAAKFDGVDPDEYKALKSKKAPAADAEAKLDAIARENAELKARIAETHAKTRAETKRAAILKAIADANGVADMLEPKLSTLVDVEERDGRTVVVVKDERGIIKYRDSENPASVADVVAELKANPMWAGAFNVRVGSGGGAQQSSGGGAARVLAAADDRAFAAHLDEIAAGKVKIVA